MKTACVVALIIAFAIAGTSCATRTPLVTLPYRAADTGATAPTSGLVYFTPRTLLRVEVTYTVTFTKKGRELRGVAIRKPVVVTPETQPDPVNRFLIRADDTASSAFADSNVSVKLTESGLLASIDADVDDKTLAALRGFVSASASIARVVAVAGLRMAEAEDTVDEDVRYAALLDPASFTRRDDHYEHEIVPTGLIENANDAALPRAVVRLFVSPEAFARAGAYPYRGAVKGVVHRRPEPIYVEVKVPSGGAQRLAAAQVVSFDQFGEFLVVPVAGKAFSSRKTVVKLGAGGGVTEVAIESKASAAEATKQLAGVADDVRGAIEDLRFNMKTAELEAEKKLEDARKELVETETALLKAQRALEAAKETAAATPRPSPTPKKTARPAATR